jgi:hypothetical protein
MATLPKSNILQEIAPMHSKKLFLIGQIVSKLVVLIYSK